MEDININSEMTVTLIDSMGTDLTVVNAARVSFNKESEWEQITPAGPVPGLMLSQDEKLIYYLARNKHWTPFGHCVLQFRIKAPIFVARQLGKHQVGLVWNEVSRRYVDYQPEFFKPKEWRGKPEKKKQGSSEKTIEYDCLPAYSYAQQCYTNMLDKGIAPELARMVLPQSIFTEWYWTGSLLAFSRICSLRLKDDAQFETRQVAIQIDKECFSTFPISWDALSKS